MKKLKLALQNIEGGELLTREQLKKVIGGVTGSGGGCYVVKSTQGYNGCWYISDATPSGSQALCERVYGDNCLSSSENAVNCAANNCTMN